MTDRLYEEDSFLREFEARVTDCVPDGQEFWVTLDRTAFFPEGGGQSGDRGSLGSAQVLDTQLKEDEVRHRTDIPLEPGSTVQGLLDWDFRFTNMQLHSGEHILSGVVHGLYGCNNVGFHMGRDGVTVDFDRNLTPEEVADAEDRANRVIWEDRPVTARYLKPGEQLDYRSKKELTGPIRIAIIQDCDCCACCAPHVKRTGQVGLIKILDSEKHRGGIRIHMLAGRAAIEDYGDRLNTTAGLSRLLSAKQQELIPAVQRVMNEKEDLDRAGRAAADRLIEVLVGSIEPTDRNLVFFQPDFTMDQLRRLSNAAAEKTTGVAATFSGGNDGGYIFAVAGEQTDLSVQAERIRDALEAKGGGSAHLFQGSCGASEEKIRQFFSEFPA